MHDYLNLRIARLRLHENLGLEGSKRETPKDQHGHKNNRIRKEISFGDFRQKNTIKYRIFEDTFEHKTLINTYGPYNDLYEAFMEPGLEPYGAWPGPELQAQRLRTSCQVDSPHTAYDCLTNFKIGFKMDKISPNH